MKPGSVSKLDKRNKTRSKKYDNDAMSKNADISKIKRALVLKVCFLKLRMCMYIRTKFQVSNIILTSFRWGS